MVNTKFYKCKDLKKKKFTFQINVAKFYFNLTFISFLQIYTYVQFIKNKEEKELELEIKVGYYLV